MIDNSKHIRQGILGTKLRRSIINGSIKGVLVLLFMYLIYDQVVSKESLHTIWVSFVGNLSYSHLPFLLFAICLMPINWALESLKWKHLTAKFQAITFSKAFVSILCGLSIGILTPQRIGEYGGRILMLETKHNWKGILATFISSISQNLFNVSLGLVGASLYIIMYLDTPNYVIISFLTFAIMIISTAFFFYYHLELFVRLLKKLPFVNKSDKIQKLSQKKNIYTFSDLSRLNIYSILRYSVYVVQYMMLLYFFGVESSMFAMVIAISTIYLVQSSIPIPPMFGILARGEIALIIFGITASNDLSILSATFSLWIINLLIPSFLGLLVVLNINVLQSFRSLSD